MQKPARLVVTAPERKPPTGFFAGERPSVTKSCPWGSKSPGFDSISFCQTASWCTLGSFRFLRSCERYSLLNSWACASAPQLSLGPAGAGAGAADGADEGAAPGAPDTPRTRSAKLKVIF